MAIRDILLHVEDGERGRLRLELALALARKHEAHLAAFGIDPLPGVPLFLAPELAPNVLEVQMERIRTSLGHAEAMFRERLANETLSSEWRVVQEPIGDIARVLCRHARYVDLTVVGQADPEDAFAAFPVEALGQLLLGAGGPVLVVPHAGAFRDVGRRVVLTWNGSREAARAARDALPLLSDKAEVVVLQVNPPGETLAQRGVPGVDIAHHLARHGFKVHAAHVSAPDIEVGDIILSRSADAGADLIVMGAYGHTRLRELVLGGATRHVLRHMTTPVLMSH